MLGLKVCSQMFTRTEEPSGLYSWKRFKCHIVNCIITNALYDQMSFEIKKLFSYYVVGSLRIIADTREVFIAEALQCQTELKVLKR